MESSLPLVGSEEYKKARAELEELKQTYNLREPDRGETIEDPEVKWRIHKPDYTLANLAYLQGKTMNHSAGSLEELVENIVKTWEMEASHKKDFNQWSTVEQESYVVACNGSPEIPGEQVKEMGNYNALLGGCRPDLWNSESDFETSHRAFQSAFPTGFPWEVLAVLAGPSFPSSPHVVFTWRHWAQYSGIYTDCSGVNHQGTGELVELYGLARVTLNPQLKIKKIDVQYKPDEFLEVLHNLRPAQDLAQGKSIIGPGAGCPFVQQQQQQKQQQQQLQLPGDGPCSLF